MHTLWQRTKVSYYLKLDEASKAAQRLGVESIAEYRAHYSLDPRLPADPESIYDPHWAGWGHFLNVEGPTRRKRSIYKSYEDASRAARRLGITTSIEYRNNYREDPKLPAHPEKRYKEFNERGKWPGFLGAKTVYTYSQAQAAAQAMGISSAKDYREKRLSDPMLPANPRSQYPREWKKGGWQKFLGNNYRRSTHSRGQRKPCYPDFDSASQAVQRMGIKSSEYSRRRKEDPLLPADPSRYPDWEQKGKWRGLVGSPKPKRYTTLEAARRASKRLGFKSFEQYKQSYKSDPLLPSSPDQYYPDFHEAGGWRKFLGLGPRYYKSLAAASKAACALGLNTCRAYRQGHKQDPRLHSHPEEYYAEEWEAFGKWNGFFKKKEKVAKYKTWREARNAVLKLDIRSASEYKRRRTEDPRLPAAPDKAYAHAWYRTGKWIGFVSESPYYRTFEEASDAACRLGIKSFEQYKLDYRLDPRLMSNPQTFYGEEWQAKGGLMVFLKKKQRLNKERYTFVEAKKAARRMGIKTTKEYVQRYREDPKLPSHPCKYKEFYSRGGMRAFLGT